LKLGMWQARTCPTEPLYLRRLVRLILIHSCTLSPTDYRQTYRTVFPGSSPRWLAQYEKPAL
jgi:hypothetical protein